MNKRLDCVFGGLILDHLIRGKSIRGMSVTIQLGSIDVVSKQANLPQAHFVAIRY